jgi:ribosome-binding factor A
VAEQLRGEIARLLREKATDPRLKFVTLTHIDVTPDLANARVFWSHLQGEDATILQAADEALQHAAGFLRHELAAASSLRRTPALHFQHDPSPADGARTLRILQELQSGPQE